MLSAPIGWFSKDSPPVIEEHAMTIQIIKEERR